MAPGDDLEEDFTLDYQSIFRILNQRKIDYLVAGGVAVNFHGIPRMTYDLDLMMLLEKKNIHQMVSQLLEWGYRARVPVDPFELENEKTRAVWKKEKHMKAFSFFSETHSIGEIDLLIESPLDYNHLKKRAAVFVVEGIDVPVISIKDLIDLKLYSGRKQDLSDVSLLQSILEE